MSAASKNADNEYERDFFTWTERQAALLRQLATETRGLPNELDIENIAEELESLGRSDLRAIESQMANILSHLLKAVHDPLAPSFAHWRGEILAFHFAFLQAYTPSMRQRLDIDRIWHRAKALANASLQIHGAALPRTLPPSCPLPLEAFLTEDFDFHSALALVAGKSGRAPPA